MVETPVVGFAMYNVAFVGVYALNFPWMDVDGYMTTPQQPQMAKPGAGSEAANQAIEMLGQMRKRLHMAQGWSRTIYRLHQYFRRIKKDYNKNVKDISDDGVRPHAGSDSHESTRHFSLNELGDAGGADDLRLLERTLQEFAILEDQDVEMDDNLDDSASTNTTVKSEEPPDSRTSGPPSQAKQDGGPWNAINHTGPTASPQRGASVSTPTNGQFRSYDVYQQPQPPTPNGQPVRQYQPPLSNFRPSYLSQESPATSGLPPTQSSPTNGHGDYAWASKPAAQHATPATFASTYTNGATHQPTAGVQANHSATPQTASEHVFDPKAGEAWLTSLPTALGSDDLAAFVDGADLAEWTALVASHGFAPTWLSQLWGGANGAA